MLDSDCITPKVIARFWSKVDARGGPDACWAWIGAKDRAGYGRLRSQRNQGDFIAHRLSWEFHRGGIPNGLWVLHHCDNPPCVNPAHLFLGTCADNIADRNAKGRTAAGSRVAQSKLLEGEVEDIRAALGRKELRRVIAARFGVSPGTIDCIAAGRTWARTG